MKAFRVELSRVVTQTAVAYVTCPEGLHNIQNAVCDLDLPIDWQTAETGHEVSDIQRTEEISQ